MADFILPDADEVGGGEGLGVLPPPEEDDELTKFNKEWNERLEKKKAAELAAEKQHLAEAQEEFQMFTQQREIKLAAKKDSNRSQEQVLLEQQVSELDGNTWDRVLKLVDSQDVSEGSDKADTSRMRKLFIQLKNEPLEQTRAAGAEA